MQQIELTILSFGAGQDSTALLYEYVYNPVFKFTYGIKNILVLIAETGNEHEETYSHLEHVTEFCKRHNIPFQRITFDLGFHQGSWSQGLIPFYERTTTCGSKAFKKTCTDNLKIKPIYRFLDHYIMEKYNLHDEVYKTLGPETKFKYDESWEPGTRSLSRMSRKASLKLFAEKYGKIQMMIGIAYGEETRIASDNSKEPVWMRKSIQKVYPLTEMKLDRAGCQDLIKGYGEDVPPPSNCIICPFLSYQELLYMYRFKKTWFDRWVILEKAKLDRFADLGEKNLGVFGKRTLPQALEFANKKFGKMTDEELKEYKHSHGHCVKSRY